MGQQARTVSASFVIAGLLLVSGCLGGLGGTTPAPETEQTPVPYEPPDFDQLHVDNGTLVVNHTYEDEHTEYLAETDSVRYVRAWRRANQSTVTNDSVPEQEPVYETMSFEQWGEIQCGETMTNGLITILHRRTATPLTGVNVGISTSSEQVTVMRTTTLNRDGDIVSKPSISYQQLSTVTPNELAATLTFANRSSSCDADVTVTNETSQQD